MNIKILTLTIVTLFLTSCGGKKKEVSNTPKEEVKQEVKKDEVKTTTSSKVDLEAPTLDNKGIGKYKNVQISDKIDEALVVKGKEIYKTHCTACHKINKRYIGPPLKGITKLRSPEWIMNMVTNSKEMLEKDPVAKALITEYHAPMAQQTLTDEEVRALYEYLRTKN